MTEPTQAQIEEFWGLCGLTYKEYPMPEASNSCEAMCVDGPMSGWYEANGRLVTYRHSGPVVDLNNLFKWAVPKVNPSPLIFDQRNHGRNWICSFISDTDEYEQTDKTPELALFWAIYQALGGKK